MTVGLAASNIYLYFNIPFYYHLNTCFLHWAIYTWYGTNISIRLTSAVRREVSEALTCPVMIFVHYC